MTDDVVELRDPALIESFLRRDAALHIYELGDLDPVFWPYTRWFGWLDGAGRVEALVLLYQRDDLPVLLAFDREARGLVGELLERVAPRLPERVYAHLSPGLLDRLGGRWTSEPQGRHLKMELRRSCMLSDLEVRDVERLGLTDAEVAHALYDQSYPGHWFDARMLETGEYFRIRRSGTLVSVAGVHVLSRQHGVDEAWLAGPLHDCVSRCCNESRSSASTCWPTTSQRSPAMSGSASSRSGTTTSSCSSLAAVRPTDFHVSWARGITCGDVSTTAALGTRA